MMILDRIVAAVWGAVLSYFIMVVLGQTRLLSSVIGNYDLISVIDTLFIVLTCVCAIIIWKCLPKKKYRSVKFLSIALALALIIYI